MRDRIDFTTFIGSFYSIGRVEAVQLTANNFLTIQDWLEEQGCESSCWTNESFIVGLWIYNTWHDRGIKTPVAFGWWLYLTAERPRIGAASEVSLKEHYQPA